MKTITTQLSSNQFLQYKQYNKGNNKHALVLATAFVVFGCGFLRSCFSHLCLKGNSKVTDFPIAFYFAKKEGVRC